MLLSEQHLLLFEQQLLPSHQHLLFHDLLIQEDVPAGHPPLGRPGIVERPEWSDDHPASPPLGMDNLGRQGEGGRQAAKDAFAYHGS